MSLNKQLWAIIMAVVFAMFIGAFVITITSNANQLSEQLAVKDNDSANLLAQMLSQVEKEEALLELLISAQFDTGHYEYIRLLSTDQSFNIERTYENETSVNTPRWFTEIVSLRSNSGVAQVSDGWSQFGTLEVRSHSGYLTEALWQSSLNFFYWSALIALVLGLLGSAFLRLITRPLEAVIYQAEALGERRFITTPVPKTIEYKRLVTAMNTMTERVKAIIAQDNQKLKSLRREVERDNLTGLLNRSMFIHYIESLLNKDDQSEQHGMIVLRVNELDKLNLSLGRQNVDNFLTKFAETLEANIKNSPNAYEEELVARLNGSDFAIALTQVNDLKTLSERIAEAVRKLSLTNQFKPDNIFVGSMLFSSGEAKADVLMRMDTLLTNLLASDCPSNFLHVPTQEETPFKNVNDWREALDEAINTQQISYTFFPVCSLHNYPHTSNEPLQQEGMLRANLNGKTRNAGFFIPWARRLGRLADLELTGIRTYLKSQSNFASVASFKLSNELITDAKKREELLILLSQYPHNNSAFEFHESIAIQAPASFASFCIQLKRAGAKVGLQSALNCFESLSNIHELGLDYIKFHASLTQAAHESDEGRQVLRAFCSLGHSLNATTIVQGFALSHDKSLLKDLGVDAVTGPGVNPG